MIDVSYILAGALTGFVVGLTGVGGGAMMTPILLLFFIGMELSLSSFRLLWKSTLFVVICQISLGLLILTPLAMWFDWPTSWLLLGGFCLALSSTAVAFNILEEAGATKSRAGRITIGILIAQDLAVAPMLLIMDGIKNLPLNASKGGINIVTLYDNLSVIVLELGLTIALIALVIYYLSKRKSIHLAWIAPALKRPDLLPLIALATCFGIASLAGLIGLSPAFGAFMAGLIVGNSRQRESLRKSAEPVQVVLLMIFFLSVGLLLDLNYVWKNLGLFLSLWLFIILFKTGVNYLLVRLVGFNPQDSLNSSLVLAQMGEFSFVLGATAFATGLIDTHIHRLLVALTVLSLVISPLYVQWVRTHQHHAIRHIDGIHGTLRHHVTPRFFKIFTSFFGFIKNLFRKESS